MTSRNATLGKWFRPLFFGTLLGAWSYAIASALLYSADWVPSWVPGVGIVKFAVFLIVCTFIGGAQALLLGTIDVVLLWTKLRALPTGRRAWGSAFAAPVLAGLALRFWPSLRLGAIGVYLASTLIPMAVVALALRLFLGKRPDA